MAQQLTVLFPSVKPLIFLPIAGHPSVTIDMPLRNKHAVTRLKEIARSPLQEQPLSMLPERQAFLSTMVSAGVGFDTAVLRKISSLWPLDEEVGAMRLQRKARDQPPVAGTAANRRTIRNGIGINRAYRRFAHFTIELGGKCGTNQIRVSELQRRGCRGLRSGHCRRNNQARQSDLRNHVSK